jgi:hypothetical protein
MIAQPAPGKGEAMLGFKSLEQKLREGNGKTARATVLTVKAGIYTTEGGGEHGYGGTDITRYHYTLRVEPDGEQPFEAKVVIRHNKLSDVEAGATVAVLYDPDDHDNVAFDLAGTKQQVEQEWEERIRAFQPAVAPPAPAPATTEVDQLAKLADLHDRGVLTQAEFDTEKAKILGS